MRHVIISSLIAVWLIGCGVVQIKPKKRFDPNPPTVDAPADADPRIRDTWNQAEVARARTLRDEDRPQLIQFGSFYGPCRGYIDVYDIDPGFTAGTMFQKVTVRERMKEMCQKAVDYAKWCRGQGKTQGCGDAATVTHIISVLEGRPQGQQQPTAEQATTAPPPTPGGVMLQQESAGREILTKVKEIIRQRSAKQITTCEALKQLRETEQQVPPDVRELYRATMNLERIPPEGIPGFIRPDQIEAARQATGEQRAIIFTGVEMDLRSNAPATQRDYLEALLMIDRFRRGTYKKATANALGEVGVRRGVPTSILREWAEVFRCLGDYSPTPKSLNGAGVAMIMDSEITRLDQSLQAESDEEARCQADPKCVKQREIDGILSELCPLLAEIDEVKARLKVRLREAKKYGVINKSDQYEDMEDKQFCQERATEMKRDYREVAKKKFSRKLCKGW